MGQDLGSQQSVFSPFFFHPDIGLFIHVLAIPVLGPVRGLATTEPVASFVLSIILPVLSKGRVLQCHPRGVTPPSQSEASGHC